MSPEELKPLIMGARQALLMLVDTLERYAVSHGWLTDRTSELRKIAKR